MALECSLSALTNLDQTDPDAVQALLQSCTGALLSPTLWAWTLGITVACALVGAFIGGILFGMLAPDLTAGIVGRILVAFVGAVILLAVLRLISPGRRGPF